MLKSLLLKLQVFRDSNIGPSCEICQIFKNISFEGHLRTTASEQKNIAAKYSCSLINLKFFDKNNIISSFKKLDLTRFFQYYQE